MKLYVNPMSPNARRAMLVAHLVDLPVEVVQVDMRSGEHKQPAYLAINPNHKVPALTDGDLALWESNAICQYLAAKAGRTDLWPTDPAEQADVSRWQFWMHSHFNLALNPILFERVVKGFFGMGEADEGVVAAKLPELRKELAVMEGRLSQHDWLASDHLTLADLAIAASLTYAPGADLPLDEYPSVVAWFGRIRELDAWRATDPLAHR
ncbi:MAG: glutathione S-transferase family protein [Alphaproteobacteria bacterium]|nr:glutathione S-transferase family protein [Alphaproteobacteria bacterium]MCB9695718.1 glutathione S-transferase family protein [Alphaproteobacteria bacterium]